MDNSDRTHIALACRNDGGLHYIWPAADKAEAVALLDKDVGIDPDGEGLDVAGNGFVAYSLSAKDAKKLNGARDSHLAAEQIRDLVAAGRAVDLA